MKTGFRIARIFGIDIELDWSWLVIFVLVTWNLFALFSNTHPEWGIGLSWGLALIAAVLFFTSVLIHELAHSMVAKAQGIPVRHIRLFLFGGVSNIEREPISPGAEFVMALVGPAASIVLGIFLVTVAGFVSPIPETITSPSQVLAQLGPVTTLLIWLGSVNVFLGFFNLLPAFPLDGGRILRSLFWVISNSVRRATKWASWVSQAIAWVMIVAGISMVFGVQIPFFGSGISGLWLAFIGWFLHSSAVMSYRQVVVQDILEDVPVTKVMRANPPTVIPTMTIDNLVQDGIMGTDDHAFPVVEQDKLVGMVTIDDVRTVPRDAWGDTTVSQIMTPADQLVSVSMEEDAAEAFNRLQARDVRQLPVMNNGALAGLLRRRDIVRWLQLESELQLD